MKFATRLILLVAGTCLFRSTSARIIDVPVDMEESTEYTNDLRKSEHGCRIQIRDGIKDPQPVFLKTNASEFYSYSDTGFIEMKPNQTLQMFCSSEFTSFPTELITATCVNGSTFIVDGKKYEFSTFVCNSWPKFSADWTGKTCNGGDLIKVGFSITPKRFVEQMQVCFNKDEEVTRYVHYTLNSANLYFQTNVNRINFQSAGFFSTTNTDNLYSIETQQETIDKELGGVAGQYFNQSKNLYLSRGHLAAKADFVYGTQQRATFLLINVAPQWQVFNSGNWARVEDGIREWLSKKQLNVDCYTGVYGVATLPNREGVETPLYLAYDSNNNGLIAVPKLYFRLIIESATKKGIAFVGVNNPHLTEKQIKADYVICNDISDKVDYINWKRDIMAGYSYACEVSDFLKTVKTLPHLSAPGGLLI